LSFVLNIIATPQLHINKPTLFSLTTDCYKFHNLIDQNINLKTDIDEAVNNLTPLIHSAASLLNTFSTSKLSSRKQPFLPEQVHSLLKSKARAYYQYRLPSHKITYNRLTNSLKNILTKQKINDFKQKLTKLSSLDSSL